MKCKVDLIKGFAEYAMPLRLSTWILAPPCVLRVEWSAKNNTFTYVFVFQPSSNGSHVFSLSCASSCELWISVDDMERNMSRIIKLEPWESTNYQQWDKCVKFLVVAIQCIDKTNAYLEITLASIAPLNI